MAQEKDHNYPIDKNLRKKLDQTLTRLDPLVQNFAFEKALGAHKYEFRGRHTLMLELPTEDLLHRLIFFGADQQSNQDIFIGIATIAYKEYPDENVRRVLPVTIIGGRFYSEIEKDPEIIVPILQSAYGFATEITEEDLRETEPL